MSAIAMHTPAASESRSIDWKRFALVGIGTVLAAVLANTLFYYLGGAIVNYDPDFVILSNPGGAIIFTLFPAIIAVALYAGLLRYAENPARVFTIISAIVLVLSVIPDFTYIPSQEGATAGQAVILAAMHVIAAGVIVWMLTRLTCPEAR